MLEDEGNIFPNPDTVIEYQLNTTNKKENSRIEIRIDFERTLFMKRFDNIRYRSSGDIDKVATNNLLYILLFVMF